MTKVLLLKWLDRQKAKALEEVDVQKDAAFAAWNEEKYLRTNLAGLVAEIEPKLREVYDRVAEWHKENEAYTGRESMLYGSIRYHLCNLCASREPLIAIMKKAEFQTVDKDNDIRNHYVKIKSEVERTYDNVKLNVNKLATAKLGLEYLAGLGFDLTELIASDEKPVETALAVPINTAYLLLPKKEAASEH